MRLDAVQGGYVMAKYLEGGNMVNKGDSILRLENQDLTLSYVNHETEIYRLINELQSTRLQLRQNRYNMESALSELRAQRKTAKDLYDRNKCSSTMGLSPKRNTSSNKRTEERREGKKGGNKDR